ncbi:glutamate receptor ionotropic, kainate 5-like [Rhipicephalus sanguineus]|uniref:glutamate receptor ionotropic, kainate 5-like n=1 Tax=Rhipicephalus sanguineus TaxID=34632 RepID=UPI0018943169|nr:glutamate receptor ionotropic, kainate 5-like [Rhipicephalus sanguineus]
MNHVPHGQFYPNGSLHHITFASGLLQLLWDTAERFGIRHKTTILNNPEWGIELPNGSWTGFIGELQRNESDVSFTLFYPTNSRNKVAQPTSSVWTEDVVILGAFGNDTSQGSSIAASLTVFERDVWITLGVCLLVLGLIMSLAPGSPQAFTSRLVQNLLSLTRSMCLQVNHGLPLPSSSRVVVATWWLAMLVFANVFTGKMKAGLTVRHKSGHRIDSAAQLAAREDVRVYMLRGPAYPLLLALSPNEHDRQVYRKLKPGSLVPYRRLWSAHVLDQVVAGKAVIIGDRTTLLYHASEVCHRYPHHEFYMGKERLFSHPLVVYYNRENVRFLMNAWERRRAQLTEAGVVLKWHGETVVSSSGGDFSRCPRVDVGEQDTLHFDHLHSVFLLLLTGHGLALAALVAELPAAALVNRCGRRNDGSVASRAGKARSLPPQMRRRRGLLVHVRHPDTVIVTDDP